MENNEQLNLLPQLTICIVNWNSGILLENCVNSIYKYFDDIEIIIFDNASTDNSISLIEKNFFTKHRLKIIKSNKNLGFGKACNLCAKESTSRFLLFLNPDTVVNYNSIVTPLNYLNDHKEIGVVSIMLKDMNNHVARSCARFPTLVSFLNYSTGLSQLSNKLFKSFHMHDWNHLNSTYVDHVIGAFYLIKKDVFNEVRGFDEDYFLYFEDLDLSKKVKNSGYKIYYISTVFAYHIGGGTTAKIKNLRLYYSLKSKLLYCNKHLTKKEYYSLYFIIIFFEFPVRIISLLLKFKIQDIFNTFSAFKMLYLDLLKIKVKKNG